ncbi:MAG TPA: ABC transporter permease [Mucilaginibacter sp.]|jgi:ABC-type antimicrobial peptide transport system permease subunit
MLQNYFTIAWRSLWKNKVFSLINIFGLSIGIAFTLLVGAYVWGELRVNHDLKDADNQYILLSKWKNPNMGYEITSIAQLPKILKELYPNLVTNYYHWDAITSNISKGDKHFRENIQVGDSTLLSMYGLNLLRGDAKTAFTDPFSAVITKAMAIKYFGKTDIIGQTVTVESFTGTKHDFTISGVLNNLPDNTVTSVNGYKSDFFLPAKAAVFLGRNMDGWNNTGLVSYIELNRGITPKDLEKPMQHLIKENAPQQISDNLTPYLVPLKSYYLDSNNRIVRKMTNTVSFIALFILLMAIINFVNICIGRSSSRMKEMGIRKVLGGLKKQLIWQFLIESTLLVMLATIIALVIYLIARPWFSDILGKEITGLFSFPPYFLFIPILFALFIGLLAGFYPALVLSALKSVDSLKGKLSSVKERVLFRKTLVAFQFGTAAVVFIGAIIVSQQVDFFFSKDIGFDKDYVVYAQVPRDWSQKGVQKMETIRYQLAQMPEVSSISLSYEIPDQNKGGATPIYRQGTNPKKAVVAQGLAADNQYAAAYNIPLKAGKFFSAAYAPADSTKIVINETASKALGWNNPKDAIGQTVIIPFINAPCRICGITSDFHFGSMQSHIEPIVFLNVNFTTSYRYFSIKLKPYNVQKSIASLQRKWNQLLPGAPFEYDFMDDALKQLYQTEIQLKKAAFMATVLAMIIVMLGVLGLISMSLQKRTKEIGIRKVLGSSVPGIINLFIKEFLAIVAIAGVIACPLAYLMMQKWLDGYAYRVTITGYPFILSIMLLTFITALLITIQTIKAALNNPVKSLRTE